MRNIFQEMSKIVAWATDAAREHIELAQHAGLEPESETTMGLRQSFDYNFPQKEFRAQDWEIALSLGMNTYTETVKAFSTWTLSPMGWALTCKAGDSYSYSTHGVREVDLDQLIEVCIGRGLELFGDDNGLHVERFESRFRG